MCGCPGVATAPGELDADLGRVCSGGRTGGEPHFDAPQRGHGWDVEVVVVVVVAILILDAPTIFNFSLALLIGLLSGVFSSIFIAVPLWGMLKKRQFKKTKNNKLVVHKEKKSNDEKILV